EAVHKELGNRMVRAATTASSLEAEQDNGNTNKTQSKATPNESSSQGTNSGDGPRCQDTMGDTTAKTRFKSIFKHSNDSPLAIGRRIDAINADDEITLINDANNEMIDVNDLSGEEMFVAR
nr:hypothetical protein [Tanacetum cinerariifolium]